MRISLLVAAWTLPFAFAVVAAGAVGLVTHGGATRALVSNVLGIGFGARRRLVGMRNTAIAGVEYGRREPVLSTYNIAPHLDPG